MKDPTGKAFKDFPSEFRGVTIRPEDAGYAKAREIYNMRHDAKPAMIARAADSDDVVVLMQYANEKGFPVAIRSGGHSSDGWDTAIDGRNDCRIAGL